MIIGNDRQRFLFSETADVAPIADVVSWLDFAYEENRGYGWVDVLRTEMPHWRPDRSVNVDIWPGSRSGDRRALREATVPSLARLTARARVLEGHVDHAALLAQLGTPPVVFSARIAELAPQAVDGFLIV